MQVRLQINNTVLVCPCVDFVQTRERQQHRRRRSAVQLTGSCRTTWLHATVRGTRQRGHSSNVLMHAWLTPTASLLIGKIARITVIYMRLGSLVDITRIMELHILTSSDDVIRNQVRDIISL